MWCGELAAAQSPRLGFNGLKSIRQFLTTAPAKLPMRRAVSDTPGAFVTAPEELHSR
jgi:hypothetical protein